MLRSRKVNRRGDALDKDSTCGRADMPKAEARRERQVLYVVMATSFRSPTSVG